MNDDNSDGLSGTRSTNEYRAELWKARSFHDLKLLFEVGGLTLTVRMSPDEFDRLPKHVKEYFKTPNSDDDDGISK